jgi:prepilin-type N-terminal cleavage/methylation domain-containing protein
MRNHFRSSSLKSYLSNPKVQKVLQRGLQDQGFSLIELVVVVAILAILAAVALPNFLGVSKDAQIAAAKNTLATIVKECVVADTRGEGNTSAYIKADDGKLNGFSAISMAGADCYSASVAPVAGNMIATFGISYLNGVTLKNCTTSITTTTRNGCFADTTLTGLTTAGNAGSW